MNAALLALLLVASPTDRLVGLCKLWGKIKFLHPYVAYKDIDWDKALLDAIPKVEAAKTAQEYSAAIESMIAVLHDPATHLKKPEPPATLAAGGAQPLTEKPAPGVLLLHPNGGPPASTWARLRPLEKDLLEAKQVIFDLRAPNRDLGVSAADAVSSIANLLPVRPTPVPAWRHIVRSGYQGAGFSTGGYYIAFSYGLVDVKPPPQNAKGARRYAFLVDANSSLPEIALALQRVGDAVIIAENGAIDADLYVPETEVAVADGVKVQMRTAETADGYVPHADANAAGDAAVKAALGLLARAAKKHASSAPLPPAAIPLRPDSKHDDPYPTREVRLLALFRLWNVIDAFYPYKHLMTTPWDDALPKFIPRMIEAKDAREYQLALAELSTFIPDGHTGIAGAQELLRTMGEMPVPVQLQMIEGKPVVTGIFDEAQAGGLKIGDAIVKIDGQDVAARMDWLRKYLPASTRWHQDYRMSSWLLNGPTGSTATLTVRDGIGHDREVKVQRQQPNWSKGRRRALDKIQILPGNIGYADLERLMPADVDAMFEKLKGTRALIFDLRCYPNGTAWPIAPRINQRKAKYGAMFRRALIDATDEGVAGQYLFMQELPTSDKWVYPGKIVVLIDEHAISQSEHTALFFEAAAGAKFIGSRTAGANGDVTQLSIPGGLTLYFTGHDVRHADGRQLQRVGIVPDIEVRPTIAGIRAGKDEVLERAIRFIETGR